MKKKIMFSFGITIIFSLMIITCSFVAISNYQNIDRTKDNLMHYNDVIAISLRNNSNKEDIINTLKDLKERDKGIRLTLVEKDGKVIYDSEGLDIYENYIYREEIEKAMKEGEGDGTRFNKKLNSNVAYYATKINEDYIIRSAIPLENLRLFHQHNIKFYFFTLTFVILISIFISQKLTKIIVEPLNELELMTSKISSGELGRRVKITSNDELGSLGKTFNEMADQLQSTMAELIDKQNRLEAILKSMDSGVIAIDRNHRVIMINPYAEKIFGIKNKIIGETLKDTIKDFDLDNIFENPNEYREVKIDSPNKKELRIKTAEIINEGEHIGTVAVVQDITDIKILENIRSQFVANVSHELKTPLTSIKGFAETLKYVEDEEHRVKFLDIINDEAERLTRLINDILSLSNIEQNKEINLTYFDPNKVIENVYTMMKIEAKKKDIELFINLNSTFTLLGDKDKFKQMILNIVDNAIKYSEKNDKVYIETENNNGKFKVSIKDTGIGIPKKDIPRLFERFYRVDKARSRAKGGTGLGLAIVKHIIKTFNGDIEVLSEIGKGTTFIVTIKGQNIK
ncbi:two-component system histidine kinase PnpS [Clostridium fallax]|uniref:histidine kinase n=1 Tax=Clostridium fallax TaxID=1533 RepID=A0A1M4X6M4_9CLOT|nr:HAMP domain-containing sensor histidine kinase [Clostridium fallax]SHE89095.1 PAS/PAC sensor signal transduction histidine kinase [Clostridium fallax]SQB07323.1 signal transduction histidine kinase [Clostridium fallax]